MELKDSILSGDRLTLARVLTQVENNTPEGRAALDALFPHTGRAHLIGVTGAPGTGKSSLVNRLALHYRQQKKTVAIVAVDPSSPFTGGAVLGDRIRMKDLSGDVGVFIRSMASRGSLGGLAQATAGEVQVFDAAGYEIILIETVGAGQGEVDIVRLAHTTLVVEAPGLGDDIQAIKAGILEIADILVVNKADRPGVENTEKALKSMLDLAHPVQGKFLHHGRVSISDDDHSKITNPTPGRVAGQGNGGTGINQELWIPPIQKTISTEGTGIPELAGLIENHVIYLRKSGGWALREQARLEAEVEMFLNQKLLSQFHEHVPETQYDEVMSQVFNKSVSPWEAVRILTDGRSASSSGGENKRK
jgi:LAO/AO transport system kinase